MKVYVVRHQFYEGQAAAVVGVCSTQEKANAAARLGTDDEWWWQIQEFELDALEKETGP